MPKTTPDRRPKRHNPLEADILATGPLRAKSHKQRKSGAYEDENQPVAPKQAKTVFELSRELANEDQLAVPGSSAASLQANPYGLESRLFSDEDGQEPGEYERQQYEEWDGFDGEENEYIEEAEVDPNDREIFNKFFPDKQDDDLLKYGWDGKPKDAPEHEQGETRNLGAIILQKIQEAEERERREQEGLGTVRNDPVEMDEPLDERIIDAFEKLGIFLSRYKSGKVPKLFKILPQAPRWEEMIEIANPSQWTPHAVERATKIFVSSNRQVATVFLEMVLLPCFREQIHEHQKVNVHIYQAVEKSLYRADAFFMGFLFPLIFEGTCTVKEAKVISAILKQNKIPLLSGCVALEKMCEVAAQEASHSSELGSASNMFIKALIEKRYAMPFQVIDSLVFHFLRTRSMDPASIRPEDSKEEVELKAPLRGKLPLVWHEAFQIFAEFYKDDITEDQREALLDLLQSHGHPKYAPATRKELLAGRGRGIPATGPGSPIDGDDTMMIDS